MSWEIIIMSERRAVSNFARSLLILISIFLYADLSEAQAKKKPVKTKTVGDILKKIETKSDPLKVKKTSSALPKFDAGTAAKSTVNLKAVKPPSSNKLYFEEDTDEGELDKFTDEGIDQLFKLTQKFRNSSRRGELWLRLAELYVDKARLIEFKLQNEYDQQMNLFLAGKRKVKPKLNLEPAFDYNRKAIQLYEWFVRDFPKDPKMDQALFFLGFNHFELNQVKLGEQYYIRLTKEYPNSPFVNESNFALGEYHFDAERWKPASEYYARVAKEKRHRLYGFALYKLAWCSYKLNNTKQSLAYLEEVIMLGRRSKTEDSKSIGGVSRIRLAKEAIKDLVIFYAEAGDYTKSRSYFEDIVGAKSAEVTLIKLATYYMDTGNRTAAIFLFRDFIERAPNAPRSFDFQANIVKMAQSGGSNSSEFRKELYDWVEGYGPMSSWQEINKEDKDLISRANETMEFTLRNYVLLQHQTAQNARTKSAQAKAKEGYTLYLKTFQKSAKIDEMHFFYGELLFDLQDYLAAAKRYEWVIQNAPRSSYFDKSILNSLLAYEKMLPSPEKIKKTVGNTTEPVEFDENISLFKVAALRYLERLPKGPNRTAIKYRMAALYYYYNQFPAASKLFREIIASDPNTEFARYSANLLLDMYNIKKDYSGLQEAAEEIMKVPALAKSEVGAQIREIRVQAAFKTATELVSNKDFAKAAPEFESFAAKNAGTLIGFSALYNAATSYENSGDLLKAIEMYERVLNARGKVDAKQQFNAFKFLPTLYERTGQYLRAARGFEAFAGKYPGDAVSTAYSLNAGIIFDGLSSYANAKRNYENYLQRERKSEKFEALLLLAKLHERMSAWDKATQYYDQFIKSGTTNASAIVEATFSVAKIHERRNKAAPAKEWYEKTVAVQKRLARAGSVVGVGYAAEAKFKLVVPTYNELVIIKIPASGKAQAQAVNNKLAVVNRLKEQLKAVIAYDDSFQIVAALNLQARASEHMYKSLLSVPVPKGLTPEELKTYQEGVKQVADPFKNQAIEGYELAIKKGLDLQAYNDALLQSVSALAKLKGGSQPAAEANILKVELIDTMGMSL